MSLPPDKVKEVKFTQEAVAAWFGMDSGITDDMEILACQCPLADCQREIRYTLRHIVGLGKMQKRCECGQEIVLTFNPSLLHEEEN